jgi:DNA-binding transcriptional regulator YdaS (Cro superfamily)
MTKLLEQAIEAARKLSAEEQDDIARAIIQLAGENDVAPVSLTPDERAAIARSKAAASRNEFATDDEIRAVWAKHRR